MFAATGDGKESEPSTSSSPSVQWSQLCRHFEFSEIQLATENFDESLVIGRGGFGKVYKGIIKGSDPVVAAIKRLDSMSSQGADEFWAEVEMLTKLRHCNLVSLIGYCNYEREMILVYEYMPNGTLEDHLHKLRTPLSWIQRLNICIGAGRGLHYLHTGTGIQSGVIHRDIKSSNILVDENWATKISDFGLSKTGPTNRPSTYVNTLVKGTFGYLDPNYYSTGKLTRKSDVYAFGVLLFEVLCRKRAVDRSLDEEQWGLVTWAKEHIKDGNVKYIIDSDLKGEISPTCLKDFVQIAKRCVQSNPKQRPTMGEVVFSLESVLTLQDKLNKSLQAGRTIFDKMLALFSACYSQGENSVQRDSKLASNSEANNRNNVERAARNLTPGPGLKVFTFAELKRATINFSPAFLLGVGGFGNVFLCWVDANTLSPSKPGTGIAVVVKRLTQKSWESHAEWEAEVNFLGQLTHPNIITLLGFCSDEHQHLLVYEYMPNKSFDRFLFTNVSGIAAPLSWGTRITIMKGVAHGLIYLHSSELICRGLKSDDIFLDEDFNPKLRVTESVKFGPKNGESHTTTRVVGTLGYIDPEYMRTGHLTTKSDVYCFGAVLLEVLTGRRIVDVNRRERERNLVTWAKPIIAKEREIYKLMDPRLGQNYPSKGALKCAKLALICLADNPKDRPTGEEVLKKLDQIYVVNK